MRTRGNLKVLKAGPVGVANKMAGPTVGWGDSPRGDGAAAEWRSSWSKRAEKSDGASQTALALQADAATEPAAAVTIAVQTDEPAGPAAEAESGTLHASVDAPGLAEAVAKAAAVIEEAILTNTLSHAFEGKLRNGSRNAYLSYHLPHPWMRVPCPCRIYRRTLPCSMLRQPRLRSF